MNLPSNVGGRITQVVGFFDLRHSDLAAWIQREVYPDWVMITPSWTSLQDLLPVLAPGGPFTKYACVDLSGWTLLLSDGPLGTDVGMLPSFAARNLGCKAMRAVCIQEGEHPYPARILEVYSPGADPPLALERSVYATNDGGRWVFGQSGRPYDFENLDAYQQRTKSKRLTCEMLHDYLRQLGVPIDDPINWSSSVLLQQRV